VPVAEEELRWIGHCFEAALGHSKDADLIHAAEAILRGPEHAMIEAAFAFEIQHRIHDVLQRLGTRDAAAFGDVPDDENRGPTLLCEAHQPRSALAHLSHISGRAFEIRGVQRLNGIDDEDIWPPRRGGRDDRLEIRFAQQLDVSRGLVQSVRAQAHLQRGFFARRVQRAPAAVLQSSGDLEEERRFPDSRLAADENHASRDDAAAEGKVEFGEPGFPARRVGPDDVAQSRRIDHGPTAASRSPLSTFRFPRGGHLFDQGVPLAARVATAGPLGVLRPAVGTAIDGPGLGTHGAVWRGLQFANRV
jgi:hypothetical protein